MKFLHVAFLQADNDLTSSLKENAEYTGRWIMELLHTASTEADRCFGIFIEMKR